MTRRESRRSPGPARRSDSPRGEKAGRSESPRGFRGRAERPERGERSKKPSRNERFEKPGRSFSRGPKSPGAPPAAKRVPDAPAASDADGAASESVRFIYGVNPVLELLRANPDRIERLFALKGLSTSVAGELFSRATAAGVRVETLERERLARLAPRGVHQGLVAEVRHFDYLELHELISIAKRGPGAPLYVVLDGIQDPHNFGAIVRSAHALGAHGVVVAQDRAAGVTGTVAKASAGAIEHTPIARVVNISRALEDLKKSGAWVVAADPKGDKTLWQATLDGPLVIVVGSEGDGVRPGVMAHSDFRLKIPMLGQVASLNASVSAALLLAEVARQRSGRQHR